MKVRASTEARSYVQERGGALYLWTQDFGRGWVSDEIATEAPAGVEFDLVSKRGIRVYVESGLERPKELQIELRNRPGTKLKVVWGDRTWGARGETIATP